MELASVAGGWELSLAVVVGGSLGAGVTGAALTLGSGVEGAGVEGAEAIAPAALVSVLGDEGIEDAVGMPLVLASDLVFELAFASDEMWVAATGAGAFTAAVLFAAFAALGAGCASGAGVDAATRLGAGAVATSAVARDAAGVSAIAGVEAAGSVRLASATIAGCVCGAGIATVLSFRL